MRIRLEVRDNSSFVVDDLDGFVAWCRTHGKNVHVSGGPTPGGFAVFIGLADPTPQPDATVEVRP